MTEMNLNNEVNDNNQTILDSQFPSQSNVNFGESRNHIAKLSNDGSTGGHPVKQGLTINQNSGRDSESKFYEQ